MTLTIKKQRAGDVVSAQPHPHKRGRDSGFHPRKKNVKELLTLRGKNNKIFILGELEKGLGRGALLCKALGSIPESQPHKHLIIGKSKSGAGKLCV